MNLLKNQKQIHRLRNELVVTRGEGRGEGLVREFEMDTYTLLYLKWIKCVNCSVVSNSLPPHGLQPATHLCPWNSLDKNIGVGSHFLLQGIFPTQGSNLGFLHCRQILYCLSPREANLAHHLMLSQVLSFIL